MHVILGFIYHTKVVSISNLKKHQLCKYISKLPFVEEILHNLGVQNLVTDFRS
jgi:hypothetical protein